jgi:hypothetical protein
MIGYPVKQKGFFGGKLYDPEGKRNVLYVDKPFKKDEKPGWVGDPIEQKAAPKKAAPKKAAPKKAATDAPDFTGDGVPVEPGTDGADNGTVVETL